MKRKLVSTLLVSTMACALLAGCSTPTKETTDDSSGTAETMETEELAAATIVDIGSLPIEGIGAQVSSEVKANEKYKIGYIAKNTTNPYMVAQSEGVKKAGEDMGFEAVTQAPSTADSVEEQVKIMEDMIQQEVDAIIVHCADSNGIMSGVRKAEDAGIQVITIGTPAAKDTFLRTGVDYKETGEVVATEIAEALGGKGEVIILEGPAGAANAIERLEGINEAFAEYPDIEVVASQTANFKRTEGMSVTENLLQQHTNVDAIIGCNDESALGAMQAVKAAGMEDVLIAGFDGSTDATSAVASGEMFCTYNTDPYGSGYLACAYVVNFLNEGTEPDGKFIPFPTAANDPLITAETVQNYQDNIAWWKVIQ